jgi:indole-3-glycerol phosphate synthase
MQKGGDEAVASDAAARRRPPRRATSTLRDNAAPTRRMPALAFCFFLFLVSWKIQQWPQQQQHPSGMVLALVPPGVVVSRRRSDRCLEAFLPWSTSGTTSSCPPRGTSRRARSGTTTTTRLEARRRPRRPSFAGLSTSLVGRLFLGPTSGSNSTGGEDAAGSSGTVAAAAAADDGGATERTSLRPSSLAATGAGVDAMSDSSLGTLEEELEEEEDGGGAAKGLRSVDDNDEEVETDIKYDDITKSNDGNDGNDLVLDDDFEAWAMALGQWPLVPEPPPPSSNKGRKGKRRTTGSNDDEDGNPLASLLDLEALWRALQQLSPSSASTTTATALPGVELERDATVTRSSDGKVNTASSDGTILDGLYGILSVERILRAGNLFQVFESDRSGPTAAETDAVSSPSQPLAAASAAAPATNVSIVVAGKDATLFQQATSQLESFVSDASSLFTSPSLVMDFIWQATQVLQETTKNTTRTLMAVRELQRRQREEEAGLAGASDAIDSTADASREDDAERRVRAALAFSANLVSVADAVLRKGYVSTRSNQTVDATMAGVLPTAPVAAPPKTASKALFADFSTAHELKQYTPWLGKGAEMGALAGAIYEQTIPRTHALNHTVVANGVTSDVAWMVTDSLSTDASFVPTARTETLTLKGNLPVRLNKTTTNSAAPFLVRTITLRGFDASDENVDREELLMRVCTANPETFKTRKGSVVQFHSGMWSMARALYRDLKPYVLWTAPSHKVVLAGHSVGGSLAVLVLLLMTMDLGPDVVASKVLRVYTYGSPPVARSRFVTDDERRQRDEVKRKNPASCRCDVLEAFELPASLVEGYVQPWDPIVRLFSEIDPLYPLLGDVGADGVTPWASGPPRTLRPITKAIMEAWEGWPRFRDTLALTGNQTYRPVGVQHVLIPEPTRYLADRFVGVNVQVPPVATMLRISSSELLPALQLVFPLDVFEISFVPQAIRSFVHHFYPAYGFPLVDFAKRLEAPPVASNNKPSSTQDPGDDTATYDEAFVATVEDNLLRRSSIEQKDLMADLGRAAQWLRGKDSQ